jgi:hypothetical protein
MAAQGEQTDYSHAYPVGDAAVGMTSPYDAKTDMSYDGAKPYSAVFVATAEIVDRDGDIVRVGGIDTENWKAAGAPVFALHQAYPYPIGSCLNPETGKLDWFPDVERGVARCRIHFDMSDPVGRYVAGKVARGVMRAVSVAFVPIRAQRRRDDDYSKAQLHGGHTGGQTGFDFIESDMTELSIVGVGSNPLALLQGAPPALAKAWKVCKGGRCYTGCGGTPVTLRVARSFERVQRTFDRYMRRLRGQS